MTATPAPSAPESPARPDPAADSTTAESPTAESPTTDTPTADSPAQESPTAENPTADSPKADSQPTQAELADASKPALRTATPEDPWTRLLADPGHTPELLALAAVHTLGPRAQSWAARTRHAYPAATTHSLARLATHQFTRLGGVAGIVGAAAGSFAPAALVASAALTNAGLVLHLAAAYGQDPTHPQRAADLLVITGVHPTLADAEAALAAAGRPVDADESGVSGAVWRMGRMLAVQAGAWAVVRVANHYFPGTSLLAAALIGHASARTVAHRAHAYYRVTAR